MGWSADEIKNWLLRCADRMEAAAPELNAVDARLGDGDLGATLEKCAIQMRSGLGGDFATPSEVFKVCATACARASGSSFGTLLAVAFMTLTKETVGKTALEVADVEPLFGTVLTALKARGRSELGDKTALDSLEAIRVATKELSEATELYDVALSAAKDAMDEFKGKPNKIGRARMFGEKSIGLADPGMVAVVRIIG
ncbi:MAG: dihydroxyacetone kinase subunit L [Alphaproteobacteria bacterium]